MPRIIHLASVSERKCSVKPQWYSVKVREHCTTLQRMRALEPWTMINYRTPFRVMCAPWTLTQYKRKTNGEGDKKDTNIRTSCNQKRAFACQSKENESKLHNQKYKKQSWKEERDINMLTSVLFFTSMHCARLWRSSPVLLVITWTCLRRYTWGKHISNISETLRITV